MLLLLFSLSLSLSLSLFLPSFLPSFISVREEEGSFNCKRIRAHQIINMKICTCTPPIWKRLGIDSKCIIATLFIL
jgi:hypothetical protein